jgi:DNA-binding FadR family transcriptional regulator
LPGREEAEKLLARSRGLLGTMHADDVEEAVALHERIAAALGAGDAAELESATHELRELLFFLEGK